MVCATDTGGDSAEPVIISADANAEVRAWRCPTLDKNAFLVGHTMSMASTVAMNSSRSLLATGDREGRIRISEFPVSALQKSVCFLHRRAVTHLEWASTSSAVHGNAHAYAPSEVIQRPRVQLGLPRARAAGAG